MTLKVKMNRRNKVAAAVATLAMVVAGGGAAWAYWTFGGAGAGTAQTAANPTLGIVVSQTAMTGLAPGESVNLAGALTNPNNTDIKVGTLTAAISVPAGVAAADFSLTGNPQVINAVVKKAAPVSWSGMTLVYANSAVNQDNAKNVPVTLTYTLTPFVEPVVVAPLSIMGNQVTVTYTNAALAGVWTRMYIRDTAAPNASSDYLFSNHSTANFDYTGTLTNLVPIVGHTYWLVIEGFPSGGSVAGFPLPSLITAVAQ